nr:MAG: hypothetical protein DIU55_04555 [Bacillota bacterium]
MAAPESVRRLPLPAWGPADLAAALGPGPVAVLDGLTWAGRRVTLVAWAPAACAGSIAEASAAADRVGLPPQAPALLGAAVGRLDWDGTGRFWVPGAAALFDPEAGELWVRGELPSVPGSAAPASAASSGPDAPAPAAAATAMPLWPYPAYAAAVREALAAMAAGRLTKVILSVPFAAPCSLPPLQVYRRLTAGGPPGLGFLLQDGPGAGALLGLSPEPLVFLEGRRARMHLLAGTRPAGRAAELAASPKDREEHAVAVEQARRDLEAVCLPGSVTVDGFMELERHPGLVHLASRLSGTLRPEAGPADLVAACFPAGTVGGIPREAARALIERLEPIPRGWYAGALGAVLPGGGLQPWLTIRSLALQDGAVLVRTGAGLGPGSDPPAEGWGCMAKAGRALAAAGAALPPPAELMGADGAAAGGDPR